MQVKCEKRPGVFVVRKRLPRGTRVRWIAGWAAAALLLDAVALVIWRWPALSEAARAQNAPLPLILSFLAALFAFTVWIIPQSIVHISPRGIRWANTQWACNPRTRRRRHIRWSEMTHLRWRGVRTEFRTGGRRRSIPWLAGNAQVRDACALALEMYLSDDFDLSQGTVDERFRREWKAWSWRRWLLDKMELGLIGCGLMGYFVIIGYWEGYILIPTIGLLTFLCAAGVVIAHCLRESRFGWQPPLQPR